MSKYCPTDVIISLKDNSKPDNKENGDVETLKTWNGVLFVKDGIYKGGVFRFNVYISDCYPIEAPEVVFEQEIFHPLIDPSYKKLDVNVSKKYVFVH